MNKVILDSSIILSYLLTDSNYEKSKNQLIKIISENKKIYLSGLILGEIVAVLTRNNIDKNKIYNFLEKLKNLNIVIINFDPMDWLDEIHEISKTIKLKSIDLFILTMQQVYKINELVSLDVKMMQAYNIINNNKNHENKS